MTADTLLPAVKGLVFSMSDTQKRCLKEKLFKKKKKDKELTFKTALVHLQIFIILPISQMTKLKLTQ